MNVFLVPGSADAKERTAIERELLAKIPNLAEASSFRSVFEQESVKSKAEPTIILVIIPPGEGRYFDQMIEVATAYKNEVFLILISDEISASDYKRLVRTGAADWASAKTGSREVIDIIARVQQRRRTPEVSGRADNLQPVTISFVPSAGGVGNTTLVVETAIHLKKSKATQHRRICIIDLDFQTSHICDYLDCEPRLRIDEFSNAPERLDEHLFEIFTTHHGSGVDVFAAPRSKFASEALNINALDALFTMITKRYDLVLVDHPLHWFGWTSQVVAASDCAIITGINTIPCLRQISETLSQVRSRGSASKIAIVVNRCQRTFVGSIANRKHVHRVLQDEQVFFVAWQNEALESVNMGVPMTLGAAASKAQKEFAELAGFCAELKPVRHAPA